MFTFVRFGLQPFNIRDAMFITDKFADTLNLHKIRDN